MLQTGCKPKWQLLPLRLLEQAQRQRGGASYLEMLLKLFGGAAIVNIAHIDRTSIRLFP